MPPRNHFAFICLLTVMPRASAQTCYASGDVVPTFGQSGKNSRQLAQTFLPRCGQTPFPRLQRLVLQAVDQTGTVSSQKKGGPDGRATNCAWNASAAAPKRESRDLSVAASSERWS